MIKITIEQSGQTKYAVKENVVTKRTPTQYTEKSDYGDKQKVMHVEEYAVHEVEKVENWNRNILTQHIADETKFDLAAVIKAINGL